MHEFTAKVRHLHQLTVYLIVLEGGDPLLLGELGLIQAIPDVRIDEVSALHCVSVIGDQEGAAGLFAVLLHNLNVVAVGYIRSLVIRNF